MEIPVLAEIRGPDFHPVLWCTFFCWLPMWKLGVADASQQAQAKSFNGIDHFVGV